MRSGDFTHELPHDYMTEVLTRLHASISDFTKLVEDKSHRVNEFQGMGLNGESVTQIQVFPDYDMYDEIIESVMVTGPASTAFTLNLGKRAWTTVLTNAQGIFLVTPLRMKLGRNDTRILNSATAGNWTLELTGYADIDYRYK